MCPLSAACVSSRPGQSGRCDGYILEGKELEFYQRNSSPRRENKVYHETVFIMSSCNFPDIDDLFLCYDGSSQVYSYMGGIVTPSIKWLLILNFEGH